MAEQYIARFRTGTPEQRRAAIMKLGNGGDPRAIGVLQQIAAGEPDPALQKLAHQAIQHLQKSPTPNTEKTSGAPVVTAPKPAPSVSAPRPVATDPDIVDAEVIEDRYEIDNPSAVVSSAMVAANSSEVAGSTGEDHPNLAVIEPPLPRVVTEQQKNLAKSKLDQVITYQIAGQYAAALTALAEAASYDPDILNTTVGANLATTLTDLPRDQAIAKVLSTSKTAKVKRSRNIPRINFESGELVDTLIEAVILVIEMLLFYGLTSYVKSIAPAANQVTSIPFSLRTAVSDSLSNGLPQFFSIEISILAVFVAGMMLGGSAGILRFYRFMNRVYLLSYGLLAISLGMIAISAFQLASTNSKTITSIQSTLLIIALLVAGATGIFSTFIQAYAVSRAHRFGYVKGCVSVVIGIIILGIIGLLLGISVVSSFSALSGR
jgi:hypothetical protein